MPMIRVVYKTNRFDYVSGEVLDVLIPDDEITHFYRASERRWINIRLDPIRESQGWYQGPERRRTKQKPKSENQEPENGSASIEECSTKWLEDLWRHIDN